MADIHHDDEIPTAREVADWLRSIMPVEAALDLLNETAKATGGWTPELNEVGLRLLKPDAPEGGERAA